MSVRAPLAFHDESLVKYYERSHQFDQRKVDTMLLQALVCLLAVWFYHVFLLDSAKT